MNIDDGRIIVTPYLVAGRHRESGESGESGDIVILQGKISSFPTLISGRGGKIQFSLK